MSAATKPRLVTLVICRRVEENPMNGTTNLLEVMNRCRGKPPFFLDRMSVYLQITNARRPFTLELRQVDRQTLETVATMEFDRVLARGNPHDVGSLTMNLANVPFPKAGAYDFQIWEGDTLLGEYPFIAEAG